MLSILAAYLLIVGYVTLGTSGVTPYSLDTGTATLLWSGAAAAVGTIYFVVPARPNFGDRTLTLQAMGVGAVPTTVTANLEQSNDSMATWQPVGTAGTAIALVAATVGTAFRLTSLGPGPVYRMNVTTLTLGAAASAVIVGTLS